MISMSMIVLLSAKKTTLRRGVEQEEGQEEGHGAKQRQQGGRLSLVKF